MLGEIGSCTALFCAACPLAGARITRFAVRALPRSSVPCHAEYSAFSPTGVEAMSFGPTRGVDVSEFGLK